MWGSKWLAAVGITAAAIGVGFSASVQAQSTGGGVLTTTSELESLRAEQSDLFDRMLAAPDDLDLMFEYAQLSIRLQDFEAAISTLERMLIYRQDLPRVRLELGVAYFNLGSYAAAQLYFEQVLEDPETPDIVRARVGRFMEEIANRTRPHNYRLIATAGLTHATNATLGPDGNRVLFQGNLATLIAGQQEADSGVRVTLDLRHTYDLGQEDADTWRTEVGFYGVRYFDTDDGDVGFVRVRTGPRLSLDEQAFGPKLRPYTELQYLTSENRGLFFGGGVGLEYLDTLSPVLSVYGDVGLIYRNYFRQEFSDEDSVSTYAAAGLAYLPVRNFILRSTLITSYDDADGDENSNVEVGLRMSGEYKYDVGLSQIDGLWTASAFAEVRGRMFNEPDPLVDPNSRRNDVDFRAGVRHIFAIQQGFGVQIDVDGLVRRSNIRNFDLENISGTISLRYEL
ncbi:MAG: tetratricopeptide repeat protein [Pseudomonadota bacterium]